MQIYTKPPIAVVAMSGVFPKANGIDAFWQNIIHSVDTIREIPADRLGAMADHYFNFQPAMDRAYSDKACLIENGLMAPDEVNGPDSSFASEDMPNRWVVHAARQAYAQGRLDGLDPLRIGLVLAAIALPTAASSKLSELFLRRTLGDPTLQHGSANWRTALEQVLPGSRVVGHPAMRIARDLGIGGGSYTLDAACASSLYALKLACDQLQSYRSDAMISGGFSGADTLYTQIGFSQLKALSPSGRCAPFDHRADGLVVGEGVGLLVLKRLGDAQRDGNTIYGVIRGIGLSNDMRGNLLAPESAGQLRAMETAYAHAGWSPSDVDLIECHGAGTRVGDTTEINSLVNLWGSIPFKSGQCAIGSVKSMIGHLLTGAGAAGMIKTLLALYHKVLPPSLNFERPPANSPLINSPFRVQTQPESWQTPSHGGPRKAAVSAFGFGGINAHVLLEEWPRDRLVTKAEKSEEIGGKATRAEHRAAMRHPQATAIVGMDVHLGSLQSLEKFGQAIFHNHSILGRPPANRKNLIDLSDRYGTGSWLPGGFVEKIAIAPGEFQIPPNEIPDILPQQLIMLKTAQGAMKDAGLAPRQSRTRMGAVIGISFDYEATNFHQRWCLPQLIEQIQPNGTKDLDFSQLASWMTQARDRIHPPLTSSRTLGALGGIVASRIARELRFGGPSFVVSAEELSGLRALEIGSEMLASDLCDTVLVGAVDLHCDERNLASLIQGMPLSVSGCLKPFDQAADGTLPGEGAVAMVLKRLADTNKRVDRIYAVVESIGAAGPGRITDGHVGKASAYARSIKHAFEAAGRTPADIGLMECHASGIPVQDDEEAQNLNAFFSPSPGNGEHAIAIGALKPLVGHTGAVSGLASVVKSALCLYHQMLPPMPEYKTPRHDVWQSGPFYFPQSATYWSKNRIEGPRTACSAAMTIDGDCMHVVMAQSPDNRPLDDLEINQLPGPLGPLPYSLFFLGDESPHALLAQLDQLSQLVQEIYSTRSHHSDFKDSGTYPSEPEVLGGLSRQWHDRFQWKAGCLHRLTLLAGSITDLHQDIMHAVKAVKDNRPCQFFNGRGGICYLPDLNFQKNQMAFVYPGSGNHYLAMGRTLAVHWPGIMYQMDVNTERLHSQLLPRWYEPWHTRWDAGWQTKANQALAADPLRTIFGQVLFGGQMTALLRGFGLNPDAVIGYSLGESAGLFAMGAWPDRGQMLERLSSSDLFKTQLTGPCLAVRKAWDLAENQHVDWRVAVVNRPVAEVDQIIDSINHVRRLIVNTPDECVIGGLASSVTAAIQALESDAIYLEGVVAVHCDAPLPVAQDYENLHRFETRPVAGVRFYSVAHGASYPLSSEAAAKSILKQALEGFDFPRTIEQAYADGVRLFLEVGPHNSCTRMISQILGQRPHLAIAANHRHEDECFVVLKCLGTLAAAGVDLNPDALLHKMGSSNSSHTPSNSAAIEVAIGRPPLSLPDPAAFRKASHQPSDALRDPSPALERREVMTSVQPDKTELATLLADLDTNLAATAKAHEQFLALSQEMTDQFSQAFVLQNQLIGSLAKIQNRVQHQTMDDDSGPIPVRADAQSTPTQTPRFSRQQCLEFAVGSVGRVLGPQFDIIDTYRARVRLPDEPLMLVDRILHIEGKMGGMGPGRVVTQHDVSASAWYLDGGRAPVCIAVEAGQADLFLSSYLGIDQHVQGQRTYRLLDATIVFHRGLPEPGETIEYDIHIDKFVKQGATYLFFFRYEGSIGPAPFITMTNGCAGFFTEQEVRDSGGIILTDEDRSAGAHLNGRPFTPPKHLMPLTQDSIYDEGQVDALRRGQTADCFGAAFADIELPPALRLPSDRMRLIHRIITLQPQGGRFNRGYIIAEADIDPQDWFLTCHFVDDKVMPGTLMYECCAHTLRVLLLRLGWVTQHQNVCYEPVPGIACRLKCRGPVTPETHRVQYAVEIKEMGYAPQPYVIADAHMYADGQYIVFFKDMSLQLTGLTEADIQDFWQARSIPGAVSPPFPKQDCVAGFDRNHILEFAVGSPAKAFGDPYRPFDRQRRMARLPGPPFSFIDRITAVDHPAWVLKPSGWVTAQYDLLRDAWYFAADRSGVMPFSVLLEIALQPCGWLAAYAGSALKSNQDLKFRNLGGRGIIHAAISPSERTLTMRARITKVAEAADMIIENFNFQVFIGEGMCFEGQTNFGFFTAEALENQIGLRNAGHPPLTAPAAEQICLMHQAPMTPDDIIPPRVNRPQGLLMPAKALLMIDTIETWDPHGGPKALGYLRGRKTVDPDEWFFQAHFFQDPVCPGSLGVESFLQLIKYAAIALWPEMKHTHVFEPLTGQEVQWQYRGQIVPENREVVVDAVITRREDHPDPVIMADGWLIVDGRCIYQLTDFGLRLRRLAEPKAGIA